MAFFDARVFNTLFKIRYLREAGSGLGDVTYKKELNGIWIRSKSKGELIPDIVVVFVPGSWIVGGTVDMYLEYLSIFCVTLQQQGFRNPCIFAPNVDATEMNTVVESTYNAIGEQFGETHIVLAGDSIGATMIINSLLTSKCVRPPSTVLLISPITQFEFNDAGTSTCDYLSLSKIQSWLEFINPIRLSPGTEDWSNIPNMPTDGFIISYGSEECVVSYTEEFIKLLAENGCKLKIDRQVAQVHDWAIVNFYTETLIEHREESIHIYSTTLSRLLLSKTDSFFGVNRANIESIVTIDEERN